MLSRLKQGLRALYTGFVGGLALPALLSASLVASPDAQQDQSLVDSLFQCRTISDVAEKAACYDRTALALETARQSGDVVIMDRTQIREARSRLFGFNLGTVSLLGSRSDPAIEALETTLVSAVQVGRGEWVFTLADGSVWRQIDAVRLAPSPRAGQSVRIRQAAMGSYMLSVGNARSVRASRDR